MIIKFFLFKMIISYEKIKMEDKSISYSQNKPILDVENILERK